MQKMIVIVFLVFSSMSSCLKKDDSGVVRPNSYTTPSIPIVISDTTTTSARTFLALGDSYTIGQAVLLSDRFPVQTANLITAERIKFGEPEIIAQTGWTTEDLLHAIELTPPSKPAYDIVTLLIGVNNQHQGRSRQEYTDQFLMLLNKAVQYAGGKKNRVVVLSIPDYSVTSYANGLDKAMISAEIDAFNEINQKITDQAGIAYLNITRTSRLAASDPFLVAGDGLHPSGLQYRLWANLLVPIIRNALL